MDQEPLPIGASDAYLSELAHGDLDAVILKTHGGIATPSALHAIVNF
jgi:hypothetical protein